MLKNGLRTVHNLYVRGLDPILKARIGSQREGKVYRFPIIITIIINASMMIVSAKEILYVWSYFKSILNVF